MLKLLIYRQKFPILGVRLGKGDISGFLVRSPHGNSLNNYTTDITTSKLTLMQPQALFKSPSCIHLHVCTEFCAVWSRW